MKMQLKKLLAHIYPLGVDLSDMVCFWSQQIDWY